MEQTSYAGVALARGCARSAVPRVPRAVDRAIVGAGPDTIGRDAGRPDKNDPSPPAWVEHRTGVG
jgi:hypothetical protein